MEEFGERIKAIRKSLGLTQQEFANRLKIQRSTIAQYETGRNEPLSATVSLICREYNVDEVWLRTGVGEMFRPRMRDEDIAAFLGGILGGKCTDFQRRLVSVLARMDAADWEILERKLDEIYAETKRPDSIAQEAEAINMSEKEKEILEKLARVFPILPTDKQEYFLGYAEAVADVVAHSERNSCRA